MLANVLQEISNCGLDGSRMPVKLNRDVLVREKRRQFLIAVKKELDTGDSVLIW